VKVGCADGILMEFLKRNKNIDIRGLEISKVQMLVLLKLSQIKDMTHFY
jgi:hypothetical protein